MNKLSLGTYKIPRSETEKVLEKLFETAESLGFTDVGIDTARLYRNDNETKNISKKYHTTTKIIEKYPKFEKDLKKSFATFGTIDLLLLHYPAHSVEWKILERG